MSLSEIAHFAVRLADGDRSANDALHPIDVQHVSQLADDEIYLANF